MKYNNKFLSTLLIFVLNSCISNNNLSYKKSSSKYKNIIKPSESMQVGVAKKTPLNFIDDINLEDVESDSLDSQFIEDDIDFKTLDEVDDENLSKNPSDKKNNYFPSKKNYQGHYKIGKPYNTFGISYVPQEYESYEEVGIASWYGSDFHGKKTANGEVYNMGDLTAAHPTLPLPSLIKITNLKNNKSQILRVNDRGPFSKNRVIDVSEKAAELLGFKGQGTTQVRVEFMRQETDEMLKNLNLK
jgi:rare lipoprotein A (peptidoglycan hydrolase)